MNVLVSISDEDSGMFMLHKFVMRRGIPFTYTQYLKFRSNRPIKQAYNVVVSQKNHILYLSYDVNQALHKIKNFVFYTLANDGFQKDKLLQVMIMTITKTTYIAVNFKVNDSSIYFKVCHHTLAHLLVLHLIGTREMVIQARNGQECYIRSDIEHFTKKTGMQTESGCTLVSHCLTKNSTMHFR